MTNRPNTPRRDSGRPLVGSGQAKINGNAPWPPTRAVTAYDVNAAEYEGWLRRNCRKILKIVIWAMRSRTE